MKNNRPLGYFTLYNVERAGFRPPTKTPISCNVEATYMNLEKYYAVLLQ